MAVNNLITEAERYTVKGYTREQATTAITQTLKKIKAWNKAEEFYRSRDMEAEASVAHQFAENEMSRLCMYDQHIKALVDDELARRVLSRFEDEMQKLEIASAVRYRGPVGGILDDPPSDVVETMDSL